MTFEARLVVIGFAAFAIGGLAGAAMIPALLRRLAETDPAARANALMRARLLPAALSITTAVLALLSYLLFEPRRDNEDTGFVLLALAVSSIVVIAAAVARGLVLARATRRALRTWLATAEPVTLPGIDVPAMAVSTSFPVVAVVGWLRPSLVIAKSVLTACTSDELLAVLAHERGHLDRRDNLRRAALVAAPDPLSWFPISRRLLSSWSDATEEAADDVAGGVDPARRVALAQALIKVARLAPEAPLPAALPASALFRGENLDRRIRRLLAPAERGSTGTAVWPRGALAFLVLGGCGLAFGAVQALLEAAVTLLP